MTGLGYLIAAFLVVFYFLMSARLNSESMYKAYHDDDIGGRLIDLKKNGMAIYSNCFIGCSYEYGSYEIKDSILTISDIEEIGLPEKYLLKLNKHTKYLELVPINIDSSEIYNYTFTIYPKG